MIIELLALLGTVVDKPESNYVERVQATVVLVRGQEISARSWDPALHPTQREIVTTEDGRTILLRLTEFE